MTDVLQQFNEEIKRADNTPARSLERWDAAISGLACEVRQLRNELALANVQLYDLRKENSQLKVRDSNVTFHSRNVMAVNEDLRKQFAEARLELATVQDDRLRALKVAYQVTLETQTCEEACADLVRQIRDLRSSRDALVAAGDALAVIVNTELPSEPDPWTEAWRKAKES